MLHWPLVSRATGTWGTKDEATAEAESVLFADIIVLIFMTFMRTESRGATVDAYISGKVNIG
jgi:hypothetical protein